MRYLALALAASLACAHSLYAKDKELVALRKRAEAAAKKNDRAAVDLNNKLLAALWEDGVDVKVVTVTGKKYIKMIALECEASVSEEAKGNLLLLTCKLAEKLQKLRDEVKSRE